MDKTIEQMILEELRDLRTCWMAVSGLLSEHMIQEKTELSKINDRVTAITKAFPLDDINGHRRYHELLISAQERRAVLREAVIAKSLTGLIWAGLLWLGFAVWNAFKHALGLQ